ncbi:BON domain-containing protein [Microbacterium sp. 22296]|uniref:BON domain-containing protein n=1 Tax=Microbacterium sp. 22296 TaxID=3453903 RepID=UPI003F826A78
MMSDGFVKQEVEEELQWDPQVDDAGIGVAVEDATVRLSGEVDSESEKEAVLASALRVRGVRAVIDEIVIRRSPGHRVSPADVAREVDATLRSTSVVPRTVKSRIEGHDVVLTGEVDWEFQRRAARRAVQRVRGVRRVVSELRLTPRVVADDTQTRIRDAFHRHADIDASEVHVDVDGSRVILTGTVRSWAEKWAAANAAWASPHVSEVDNRLLVQLS